MIALGSDLLEVKSLQKHFRTNGKNIVRAVDGVSFSIPAGRTLGLVGESGCGKTTLGRLIMQLYRPDAGEILFNGKNIHELSFRESRKLRRDMQMVFQDPKSSLNPYLTMREIIADGMRIHKLCASPQEENERVLELLHSVGLSANQIDCYPNMLSGGQQQRVGIARALALTPRLLVCDEVVSALDVSMQAQIVNLLLQKQQENALTYLFISHDLYLVRHVSDTIAVMYAGMIMEYASAAALIDNPLHPYTQRLISSIPVFNQTVKIEHPAGTRDGAASQQGCRFSDQCKYAGPMCKERLPELYEVEPGHFVRCHSLTSDK